VGKYQATGLTTTIHGAKGDTSVESVRAPERRSESTSSAHDVYDRCDTVKVNFRRIVPRQHIDFDILAHSVLLRSGRWDRPSHLNIDAPKRISNSSHFPFLKTSALFLHCRSSHRIQHSSFPITMKLLAKLLLLTSLGVGVQSICYTSGFDMLFGKPIRSSPWGAPAKAGDCNLPVSNGGGGGGGGGNSPGESVPSIFAQP